VDQCCNGRNDSNDCLIKFLLKDHLQRDDVLGRNGKCIESSKSIDNRDRMSVHHQWESTEEDNHTDPGKLNKQGSVCIM